MLLLGALGLVALVALVALGFGVRERAARRGAEERAQRLERAQHEVVRGVLDIVHARDQMTARHSVAVAEYARDLAAAAGATEREQWLVHAAGLYHELGKAVFPDAILWAAGRLTPEQWAVVERHPDVGADLVARLEGHEEVAELIRCHHERLDGWGYPRGLSGDEIPRLARVLGVADAFDAMTASDSYRPPLQVRDALEELRHAAGTQLDPQLVELFVSRLERAGEVGAGATQGARVTADPLH